MRKSNYPAALATTPTDYGARVTPTLSFGPSAKTHTLNHTLAPAPLPKHPKLTRSPHPTTGTKQTNDETTTYAYESMREPPAEAGRRDAVERSPFRVPRLVPDAPAVLGRRHGFPDLRRRVTAFMLSSPARAAARCFEYGIAYSAWPCCTSVWQESTLFFVAAVFRRNDQKARGGVRRSRKRTGTHTKNKNKSK